MFMFFFFVISSENGFTFLIYSTVVARSIQTINTIAIIIFQALTKIQVFFHQSTLSFNIIAQLGCKHLKCTLNGSNVLKNLH